jgi:hypothetical protein
MKCRLEQFRVEIMVYVHSNLILLILIYRMWDQWLKGKTKMGFFCSIIVGGAHTGMNVKAVSLTELKSGWDQKT